MCLFETQDIKTQPHFNHYFTSHRERGAERFFVTAYDSKAELSFVWNLLQRSHDSLELKAVMCWKRSSFTLA